MKYWLIVMGIVIGVVATAQPIISNFSPFKGPVGTLVTINGTNLSNPTNITIGGVSVIPISSSDTTLIVMVMPGTSNGSVMVTTPGGTVSSANSF
jgi:hypothetical protein